MNRFKQIDVLRAFAVFLVMGRHLTVCPETISPILHRVTRLWAQGGWIGVDLFFVLSGFLVAGLLFREYEKFSEVHVGRFLIRRGFKIYPPFWLLLAATVAFSAFRHKDVRLRELLSEFCFLQNYGPALWEHTWSLAVEEHFYILLAIAFALLTKFRPRRPFAAIPLAFVLVGSVCLALRIFFEHRSAFSFKTHLFPTHLRLDSLFFGVLLSYFYFHHSARFLFIAQRFRYILLVVGCSLLVPPFLVPLMATPFIYTYGLTLNYLGAGCLLVSALALPSPSTWFTRAIAYVGSYSYSVYLWHLPIGIWGTAAVGKLLGRDYNWYLYASTYFFGALVFGIMMSVLVEIPILRSRERFFPSRATGSKVECREERLGPF